MQKEFVTLKLSDIHPYQNNPRINDRAVNDVMESIKQCGYCAPIVVDEDFVILAGHTRHKAIKKLGWKTVEVIVKEGLTEEQKRKYRLLDNKTGELAEWDMEKLNWELEGLDFGSWDFGFGVTDEETVPTIGEDGYDGLTPKPVEDGQYCYVPITHKATLGRIVELLHIFHDQPQTLIMPQIAPGSFEKKLYSM